MSSQDARRRDSLLQHRRELDATFAALDAVRAHAQAQADTDRLALGMIAELRDELLALANRVEALTRAVNGRGLLHSVDVATPAPAFALVVVDVESDTPEVLGTYLGTFGDTVDYTRPGGEVGHEPADCVEVVQRRWVPELLAKRASSGTG